MKGVREKQAGRRQAKSGLLRARSLQGVPLDRLFAGQIFGDRMISTPH